MWEEQIVSESSGRTQPQDLVWHPDALVSAAAYQDAGPSPLLGRSSLPVSYGMLVGSAPGVCIFRNRELLPITPTSATRHAEQFGGPVAWFSPLSKDPSRHPVATEDFTTSLSAAYPIRLNKNEPPARILWDGFAHSIVKAVTCEKTDPFVDLYFWDALFAGPSTQLALALLSADRILTDNQAVTEIAAGVRIDLLTEVAKLRALRILIAHLHDLHGSTTWNGTVTGVMSATSVSEKDPKNNLIRSSISAIAGLSAGVDTLILLPWNAPSKAFSDPEAALHAVRIFDLLCEESQLNKTWDPFSGAFSTEDLTESLVQAAWDLFLSMRDLSPNALRSKVFDELLPADKSNYAQSGRHVAGKKVRSVVGETIFPSPSLVIASDWRLFPLNGSTDDMTSLNNGGIRS